ncbi:cytochrome c maturation protein CcmE [Blastomonas sp.]|uniref:cytochrome c maturation protein CcmE n=1 Tax=Blastomonas sp. TaxID=1909299 RepID=UPI0035939B86
MKAKHQRLVLISIAFVALLAAGLIAAYALRGQASYFFTPGELVAADVEPGQAIRLGGMVQTGSIKKLADGVTIDFIVEDGEGTVPVRFSGITPALFVEGSGVVAEGRMDRAGFFVADNLLAKHDENYVPREMQDMTKADVKKVAGTVAQP